MWHHLLPRRIVEIDAVRHLWDSSIVITCGGGGIPVVEKPDGTIEGTEAVIDKDFAAELLAEQVDADVLMILTEVREFHLISIRRNRGIFQRLILQMPQGTAKRDILQRGVCCPRFRPQ